jgi:hypothetical protein
MVEFVTDRMTYVILRGPWRDIIVLNIHAPTEDKNNNMKGSYYEELEGVFHIFLKYHMKMLEGAFSAIVGRENIFRPSFKNKSLQ